MLYIFSDESGVWTENKKHPYYVRSFIFIKKENYESSPHNPNNLQDVFSRIQKKANRSKEVKFNDFESDPARYKPIFDNVEFKAYVVFANVRNDFLVKSVRQNDFKLDKLHKLLGELKPFLADFIDRNYIPYKEGLEKKLTIAVYYHFWLHYFEKYIIRNSKAVLKYYYKLNIAESQEYQYYFDPPQFTKKDYERIVADKDNKNFRIPKDSVKDKIKMVKSEKWVGIQLVDMVAGSVRNILESLEKNGDEQAGRRGSDTDHYFKYVRNKLLGYGNKKECWTLRDQYCSESGEDYGCFPNPSKYPIPKSYEERNEYDDLLKLRWFVSKKAVRKKT